MKLIKEHLIVMLIAFIGAIMLILGNYFEGKVGTIIAIIGVMLIVIVFIKAMIEDWPFRYQTDYAQILLIIASVIMGCTTPIGIIKALPIIILW